MLSDSSDENAKSLSDNALRALHFARLEFSVFDLKDCRRLPTLSDFSSILIASFSVESLERTEAARISQFVRAGGGLVVALPAVNKHLIRAIGLRNGWFTESQSPTTSSAARALFVHDFLPGIKDLEISLPVPDRRSKCRLDGRAEIKVLAQTVEGEPIAWRKRHGAGQIVFWNSTVLASRTARGLIVQSILSSRDVSVHPIANIGVIQIDDFPAGFIDQKREPAISEYGLSMVGFLNKIWLPDILQLGREFGVHFTFFIPFTYNGIIEPPFNFIEWEASQIEEAGKKQLFSVSSCQKVSSSGEMGFHGYNHIPLKLSLWKSHENMVAGLAAAMDRWQADRIGPTPTSFVPAMNEFDGSGLLALSEAIPSVTTICSSFMGDFSTGEGRDFGPEPWHENYFSMPRVTCGYEMDSERQLSMLSSMATMGVWTHFFHPDDIFDNPLNSPGLEYYRNPMMLQWRNTLDDSQPSMFGQLRDWLEFVRKTFPWIRYVQTSDASTLLQRHLAILPKVRIDDSEIIVTADEGIDLQIRIASDRLIQLGNIAGAVLLHRQRGSDADIYTIRKTTTLDTPLRIPLLPCEANGYS